ncbi:MAG TPA: ATP-binding protein [Verrucomicrobiae bacterium]|nr:ATP-binding protein [Verrucomicrobiae bacterium]
MRTKQTPSTKTAERYRRIDLRGPGARPEGRPKTTELYRNAEALLWKQQKNQKSKAGNSESTVDTPRLFHELQIHQVELEMQNSELQDARNRMEALLEKYTDLYDFAPVGYFSLDELGQILEVNLNGATLLGTERSLLINRRLQSFVTPASRPIFLAFLKRVFDGNGKQVCEAALMRQNGASLWADFHGRSATSADGRGKWCRVAVSDITVLKRAEEAQRRSNALESSNENLRQEIVRRKLMEKSLRESERHQGKMLDQSRRMQEQLRHLSRQILLAQEDERKKISRELHDVIAQTLTGINVRLSTLKKAAALNTRGLDRNIARTQRLVEKSVNIVHEFARELRPAVLDDLGLIPALHSFVKLFSRRTRIRVHLKVFAGVEQLDTGRRTVLFRVAQEALTNVSRHAQASRVEVSIQKLADGICMKIEDDGKSFEVERMLRSRGRKHLGLLGMRERLEMVGGHFDIESTPGKGTTITALLRPGNGHARKELPMESTETKP